MQPLDRPHLLAEEHLSGACERLRELIQRIGPCTIRFDPNPFSVLVRAVVAQQISTKAAETISSKVAKLCGRSGITPQSLSRLTDEQLQSCGLSRSKRKTIQGLVTQAQQDRQFFSSLLGLSSDEEIAQRLLPLHGIGPWTVQMFLIFGLGRLDVLPIGDLGFRIGVKEIYELEEVPTPQQLIGLSENWKPYRTIATWYFWRSREGETSWG